MSTGTPGPGGQGGVPPLAAVLLIGNLFLIVGILLVDSTIVQVVLLVVAFAMLAGGVVVLRRHAARLKVAHQAAQAEAARADAVKSGEAGAAPGRDDPDVEEHGRGELG